MKIWKAICHDEIRGNDCFKLEVTTNSIGAILHIFSILVLSSFQARKYAYRQPLFSPADIKATQ